MHALCGTCVQATEAISLEERTTVIAQVVPELCSAAIRPLPKKDRSGLPLFATGESLHLQDPSTQWKWPEASLVLVPSTPSEVPLQLFPWRPRPFWPFCLEAISAVESAPLPVIDTKRTPSSLLDHHHNKEG